MHYLSHPNQSGRREKKNLVRRHKNIVYDLQ